METRKKPLQTLKTGIDEKAPVNFREIQAGKIAGGILYRSSHPLHGDSHSKTIGKLARIAGIRCVLNLNDKFIDLEDMPKGSAWYGVLNKAGQVICLNMNLDIAGNCFKEKLKRGLRFMISHSGPYLVHCFAGIDRTGFVTAVLESLMGAAMKEIFRDNISACFLLTNLKTMNRSSPVTDENIQPAVVRYLLEDVGLSADEILKIKNVLSGNNVYE